MEQTENTGLSLSRIRLIADMSLISQCNPEEMKIAMSLIADLSHNAISTDDYQKIIKSYGNFQLLDTWLAQHGQ
ncbi:hypothetical protein PCO87_10470 [Pectobacteriaceae bacterium C52]|uniref:Uncharacterized protein n=1 Tax=Serratia sp. (strain ATCC 39006) TaxID=104623 RepID=A0A2I5T8R7_SERS3|nr:hypothetical protein [Serratia sp. ATCC 39006]AUH00973.1 hypothetical protein CWC46_14825 [Serratia sp. ATCC 39006]AUH05294.1 hypothetical protein Ser39006_014830 [Serratia sp. ATCC 39006]WJV64401.1 hypothetical protein PCO87_10470 [Pectobacteriaceae bacterium C52]